MDDRWAGERGFAAAITLALLVLVAFFCLAFADAANVLVASMRARTAADAAALAAAVAQQTFLDSADPHEQARLIAEANGATLESCTCPARGARAEAVVSVPTARRLLRVGPARVQARAVVAVDPGALFRAPE